MVKVIQDLQSLCIRIAWCRIYATIWRMGQYLESIRKVNALSKWKYDTLRVKRLPQNGFTFFRFRALSNSIPLSGIVSTPPFPILLLKTSFKLAPIDFSCTGWAEKMITTAVLSTRWPRPFFGERNAYSSFNFKVTQKSLNMGRFDNYTFYSSKLKFFQKNGKFYWKSKRASPFLYE